MSLLSWITGYDKEEKEKAQRAAEADYKLRLINEQRGKQLGDAWLDQVDRNYQTQVAFSIEEQEKEIAAAFREGLAEGRQNISNTIGGAFNFVGKALASVVFGIPLWVWLAGGVALFFWAGGGPFLARKLKGRLA